MKPPGAPERRVSATPAAATTAPAGRRAIRASSHHSPSTVAAAPSSQAATKTRDMRHKLRRLACAAGFVRAPVCLLAALALLAGCGEKDETTTAQKPTPTAPAPSEKAVGIGDQGPAFFAAPLFRALEVDKARKVVPWDAMRLPDERALTDQWLA